MVKSEQGISVKKAEKHIPLSATLIASILLALSPKEHVIAQEIEEDHSEIEIKNVYEKYHSLLSEMEAESEEDGQDSVDLESESNLELTADEVKQIQEQLLLFIENDSDLVITDEMRKEVSTVDELEALFSSLLEAPTVEEELETTEEETIEEEPEEVEEILTEEAPDVELTQESTAQPVTLSKKVPVEKSISYTVRAGDTLNKIARACNVTVSHIAQLNNIHNVNAIRVGQVLTIQGKQTENKPADDLGNLGKPMTNNEFVDFLGSHASIAAKEQNLYASVMIAQAALESGFGTSGLSAAPNHNLYGMKGRYQGDSVVMRTREYSTAKGWHHVNAHFKKYPTYLESLLDHSAYIRRGTSWAPDFYSGVWRENTKSYQDATLWLQGRYATDPAYASKLNAIIASYNLTRFDAIGDDDLVIQPPVNNSGQEQDVKPSTGNQEADSTPDNPNAAVYRVKRGDTLSRIALVYKISVQELKELNNLKSDLIFVGQSLKVKQSVAPVKPTPNPAPTKPSKTNTTSYTIKRGDTLSRIAPLYKMSIRELKELNNLKSDLIFVGQKLKVKSSVIESLPNPKPTPPKPVRLTKPVTPSTSSYAVKRGDTLSRIALTYKTSVRELKKLNNLQSDLILVGQRLKVSQADKGSNKPSVQNYQIKAGDTLSAIARRFNTTVQKLKATNKLKSDLIFVNQRLKI